MKLLTTLTAVLFSCFVALTTPFAEPMPTNQPDTLTAADSTVSYSVEISISQNMLTLFEKKGAAERTPVAEYTVGTAVRGLKTFPLGLGTVTGIFFNPWWYPTSYSRQVFRERGIELP